jgi:nucleotide-binding universal stress UspA family protein
VFGTIVLGDDESDHAKRAVETVRRLAKTTGDHVVVVHLQPLGSYGRGGPMADEGVGQATDFVDGIVAELRGDGVDTEGVVASADADRVGRSLLDIAKEHGAGLVAVGTRGRSGAVSLVLGSVAHQVIHESEVPVLVVRDLEA